MRIVDTEETVLNIIKNHDLYNADDMEIYYYYLSVKNVNIHKAFISSSYRAENLVAPYSTVERTIRKLHNKHPNLFDKKILEERAEQQTKYIQYAIGYQV
jgi:hypothetical protein